MISDVIQIKLKAKINQGEQVKMEKIPIYEILDVLYVGELKDIAKELDLDSSGNKQDVIEEIVRNVSSINKLFEILKSEELKAICSTFRLASGTKQDMIRSLLEVTDVETHQKANERIVNENLEPTFGNVYGKLKELTLSTKKIKTEKDAEAEIGDHLSRYFKDVMSQYNLGGYLGLKVDLDINDGNFGVEVKLTDSFFKSTSEIFRLFGQAIYYTKKRYGNNFIVAIAGSVHDLDEPVFREAISFLNSIQIQHIGIPIK